MFAPDRSATDPSAARAQAPRGRLPALTAVRFFAAFYVVVFHAYPYPYPAPDPGGAALARAWAVFCAHGFAAVGFFFALSGFILAWNYPAQRAVPRAAFYQARFARVYPVYALGLVLCLPFLAARTLRSGDFLRAALECVLAFSATQAWVPPLWNALNVPAWSLSVEAFLYAMFPLIVRPLDRAASTPGRGFALLAGLYALALGPAAWGAWCTDTGMPLKDVSNAANALRYGPIFALPTFAFGVVLCQLVQRGFVSGAHVRRLALPALVVLLGVLCTDIVPYMLLHNGALLPVFAVLIARCAQGDDVPPLLRRRWLVALGEASYALYILHLLTWIYVKIVLERSGFDISAPWVFPCYALLAVSASLLCHAYVELPAQRWIMARARRR